MGIRSAKEAVREARIKAGLTQEQLSEGICSLQALSRVETGVSGVSPATFQALMEHAGAPCERYPVFAGREDFDCYYALKHVRFYLDAWQTEPAWQELQKLEDKNWADNRLYYQEWLLLHSRLQYCTCCYDHSQNYMTLSEALHVTRPHINLSDFGVLLLSGNEIQILTALAQEALYLGRKTECHEILIQLESYLRDRKLTSLEKERMLADVAIVRVKYLIAAGDYSTALQTADTCRHQMAVSINTAPLFELTFLTGLCLHYTGDVDRADACIKAAFYSAHATENRYASACREYLLRTTDIPVSDYMRNLPDVPAVHYPAAITVDASLLSDGTYNADAPGSYTLGDLIRDTRLEQNLPQTVLCQGLCSKSKLSKIENRTLQPDIALTEVLLQRLGISERIFTFWGTEKEAEFYDLKFKVIHDQAVSRETIENYLDKMEALIDEKDILFRQECMVDRALRCNSPNEKIAGLQEALYLTLPDFDIHQILSYRLSWQELSILNNIGHQYRCMEESYLSTLYFLQILEYVKVTSPSILFLNTFLPITYRMYCRSLYIQKLYREILVLSNKLDIDTLKLNINDYGGYLFFYSQALGECGQYEKAKLAAVQSCECVKKSL